MHLGAIVLGRDPASEKKQDKIASKRRQENRIDNVLREFFARHRRTRKGTAIRESTRIESARLLGLKPDRDRKDAWIDRGEEALKYWTGRDVASITTDDVRTLIRKLEKGGPVSANRTLASLKTFFRWAAEEDRVPISPCATVRREGVEKARDRALTDARLARTDLGYPEIGSSAWDYPRSGNHYCRSPLSGLRRRHAWI
jgi:hypothetical protein